MVELKCPLCHSRFISEGPKAECPDCGEVFFPGGAPPEEGKAPEHLEEPEPGPEPRVEPKPQPEPEPGPKPEPRPGPRVEQRPEPEPKPERRPRSEPRPGPEPVPEPEEQESTVDKMLSRIPPGPPARKKESQVKRAPRRPEAPVVAARGRPPSRAPRAPSPARKGPDLAYIPLEYRVPRGFKPPAPEKAKRPIKRVARPRPKRPVAPAGTPVRPLTKVRPRRVKRPAARVPPVEEEPEGGGVRPISRRTSELPFWKTRSGLAGVFLIIVFVLSLAQAMIMLSMDDGPEEGGGRANILGTVVDTDGSKVVGATVILDGGEVVTTDGSGSFYFDSVRTGDHTITVEATGYGTSTWWMTVSGSNRYVTITVGPTDRTVDDTRDLGRRDSSVPMIALFFVICGGIAFVGGVFAFRGLGRRVPVIGAVAGMVSLGLYIGTGLSLIALVLLFFSEREFAEVFRCAACTGVIGGERSTCHRCGAEYHPACARSEGECVVCGAGLR